jgi:hypothetical protein
VIRSASAQREPGGRRHLPLGLAAGFGPDRWKGSAMSSVQLPVPVDQFPKEFRSLWYSAGLLMHGICRWRAAAEDAAAADKPFEISREDRRDFALTLDATDEAFRLVRHKTTVACTHVVRLLSAGRETERGICALVLNGGRLPTNEPPRELDGLRQSLCPLTAEDRAVWMEQIHAEIRAATAAFTVGPDQESPMLPDVEVLRISKKNLAIAYQVSDTTLRKMIRDGLIPFARPPLAHAKYVEVLVRKLPENVQNRLASKTSRQS